MWPSVAKNLLSGRLAVRCGLAGLFSSVRTIELRDQLDAKGVPPLDNDAVHGLSKMFNEHLAQTIPKDCVSKGWYHFFREMDDDDSGLLTYDEVVTLARKKLRLSKAEISDNTLQALWCWLDADDSDTVAGLEFSRFMALEGPDILHSGKGSEHLEMLRQRNLEKRRQYELADKAKAAVNRLSSSIATEGSALLAALRDLSGQCFDHRHHFHHYSFHHHRSQ